MKRNTIFSLVFAMILCVFSLLCWFKPDTAFSEGERRPLATRPDLSFETLLSGEFMKGFELYTTDQFPARESFRKLKAIFANFVLMQKDNNGLFSADGHLSKLEYPVNAQMVNYAKERFDFLYETYLKNSDAKVYLSIVPDKNYFLAEKNGYLAIDYEGFINDFKNSVDYMTYIDLVPLLSLDDFYRTDSHWKQENIRDIATLIGEKMSVDVTADYTVNTLEKPFSGVYLGQSALPHEPDTLCFLTNNVLDGALVSYYDTGKPVAGELYNMEKAEGKDPYEMFLSGTTPLVTIENPAAETERELVIFRDSYGSSLAPLLVPGYRKVTVVDIRYIQSSFLGNFIEFNDQDVLFLYSTTLLNNSMAMH